MNKREREVIKLELTKEENTINALERQYRNALRDIDDKIRILQSDELTQSRIYQIQYQKALRGQVEGILDKLHGDQYATIQQYLHDSYQDGYIGTMYSIHGQGIPLIVPLNQDAAVKAIITDSKLSDKLYDEIGVNINQLKQAVSSEITRGIATNMPFADIARNIANRSKAPLSRAKTIVRTESHRIQQAAANDARDAAKDRGCDVVKQWDGTLDGDTRPTHRRLDGQIRETNEPFEMDGKTAMYPGDFGKPEEDCNCRCVALTRAKWALDEDELKTLKERAEYFKLDKKDDFAAFEEKYLNAAGVVAPPVTVGGVKCTVTNRSHGFSNGVASGVKKTVDATIYTTPDGTEFVFPKRYNKRHQMMTPDNAIRLWQQVPEAIRKQAQKTIEFVDYYNPQDSYWQKVYKNFPHSYATGGQKITFYRYDHPHNDDYVVRTYCHEAGHLIDVRNATASSRFSDEKLWTKAMADDIIVSGKKSCTQYGENSNAEDFAESVAEYVNDPIAFARAFPNRAAALANIIK
jgi:hypothetical protein